MATLHESIHELAMQVSLAQATGGCLVAGFLVQQLGKWTLGPGAWWKGPLSLLYLGAIFGLLFFTYSLGIHLLRPE